MSKKLAIIGHSTRGKEVIELLEMLGGNVDKKILSTANIGDILNPHVYFFDPDSSDNRIVWYYLLGLDADGRASEMMIFTLEEFLEKYPFKVGDKVIDEADGCPGVVCEMKWDEGLSDMKYCVAFGNGIDFGWYANDSINFFKIKKNENLDEMQSKRDMDKTIFTLGHTLLPNKIDNKLEYEIVDGYEFDKVDNNKIILKPIKSKYPTTYDECCKTLDIHPSRELQPSFFTYISEIEKDLSYKLSLLYKLYICRNAYWKIAGEEMGLGKPWEPEFGKYIHYSINFYLYKEGFVLHKGEYHSSDNRILVFPTEEMRDIFYENFKELIEQCKELL